MTQQFQAHVLDVLSSLRDSITKENEFPADEELRSLFVSILTIEGAVRFGDTAVLAEANVKFCKELSAAMVAAN
jgi:hypothetical protein